MANAIPHAEREAMYREMVGKRYGSLMVVEYIGKVYSGGNLMVRVRCDCGAEFVHPAARIIAGIKTRCSDCSNNTGTLCWRCAKAVDRFKCPWAGGKPRDDWEAIPTKIIAQHTESRYTREVDSFHVISCPGFEPDNRR